MRNELGKEQDLGIIAALIPLLKSMQTVLLTEKDSEEVLKAREQFAKALLAGAAHFGSLDTETIKRILMENARGIAKWKRERQEKGLA